MKVIDNETARREDASARRSGRSRLLHFALASCMTITLIGFAACNDEGEDTGPTNQAASNQADSNAPAATASKVAAKTATASNSAANNPATAAIDGDLKTQWNAGGAPPQWIQIDLGEASNLSKVRLNVLQTPAGPSVHEIYGGATPENMSLIGTLESETRDNQWIELNKTANNVRYVRINTVKSPSWVAWREIEVYR